MEFRDCFCHCNGTWTCREDSSSNVCTRETTPVPEATSSARTLTPECRTCQAYGSVFKGDDYFDMTEGCTSYRNCFCSCNGTWNCPGRYATNICNNADRSGREGAGSESSSERQSGPRNVTVASGQCLTCNARNKIVRGNSRFELRDGCTEYRSCICRCDGSWQCQPQHARNICPEQNRTSSTSEVSSSTCTQCRAKGKIVTGNTMFELIDGCIRFTSCRCNCDGSWQCFPQGAQNICLNNGTSSDEICSMCKASNGQFYQPNTKFQFTENCVQFNCDCFCNGSWNCPAQQSRWVCTDKCLQCKVDGRVIQNNTVFTHKTGCLEYTCDCFCNGSWSCPGNTVRNTCPAGVRDNCQKCSIGTPEGNVEYEGESDFVLLQECLHYKCRCNCDGSYSCPGKDARNVCRGETIGGCRSCMVSDSEYHRGETNFTLRKDCTHFDCRCNCDGSWNCPGESARDVCLGEVPGGCRVCRVSETERYTANQPFDLRKGCINYKCKCNCDGGWSCPGEDARDVCKGEVPGGCRSCLISENEFYTGNSNFEMVKNCIHYKCRCNCDGSYNCPGKTARRVCKTGESEQVTTPACKACKISESEQFSGNSNFILERGCARYDCTCNCDGSWSCPQAKTRDICSSADQRRPLSTAQCKPCRVGSEVYPGNSQFKFTRRCHQLDCSCACSGQWTCDQKRSVNICRAKDQESYAAKSLISRASDVRTRQDFTSSSQSSTRTAESGTSYLQTDIGSERIVNTREEDSRSNTESRNICRSCVLDGRQFRPNEAFSVDQGCRRLRNCMCYCDGRWQCAEESNICEGDQRVSGSSTLNVQANTVPRREVLTSTSTGSRMAGKKSTVEVDSSAWVFVDGKDNSYVKSNDDRTGGGYSVKVDTRYYPVRDSGNSQLGQYEDKSSTTFTSSGISPESPYNPVHQSFPEDGGSESRVDGQCQRCKVDSKTYPSGAHFDMRRGCVVYKCTCMCSGSYRCRLISDNACTAREKEATCGNCIYHHMVFPGNMGFTVREGCVEKECKCECDGTYTCPASTPIQGCSADMPSSVLTAFSNVYPIQPGLPQAVNPTMSSSCTTCSTGVLVYHQPFFPSAGEGGGFVLQPNIVDQGQGRGQCSGCLIDGTVRTGNSTFTFIKDCMEMNCYCACGGLYKCSGRQMTNCSPGMGPVLQNPQPECVTCLVQGTEYPANVRFSYRDGCNEFQCSCNCAGKMMCQNQPINICPPRNERGRMVDPLTAPDDTYADQARTRDTEPRMVGELRVSQAAVGMRTSARDNCYECEVQGVKYPGGSKFFLRDGCMQRVCECNCDTSWSCSNDDMVDICKAEALEDSRRKDCKECRVDGEVFIPRQDFQLNRGCFQHNCYCNCNGSYVCPKELLKNICGSAAAHASAASAIGSASSLSASSVSVGNARTKLTPHPEGPAITIDSIPGCKVCQIDGEKVAKLSTFMRQVGCYESVCHCQCNGTASCPPHATVNTCELPDKLPMEERKGCTVGRFTFYTRVFANVVECREQTCVCRDDGTYTCKSSPHDRKVC